MESSDCQRNHDEHLKHVIELEECLNEVDGNLNEFYSIFMQAKSSQVQVSNQYGFIERTTTTSETEGSERTTMGLTKGTLEIHE